MNKHIQQLKHMLKYSVVLSTPTLQSSILQFSICFGYVLAEYDFLEYSRISCVKYLLILGEN